MTASEELRIVLQRIADRDLPVELGVQAISKWLVLVANGITGLDTGTIVARSTLEERAEIRKAVAGCEMVGASPIGPLHMVGWNAAIQACLSTIDALPAPHKGTDHG